jgi:ABC-type uncharacterized transport system auxiliary subunit
MVILLLTGCSVTTTLPPVTQYDIEVSSAQKSVQTRGTKTVKVVMVVDKTQFLEKKMYYKVGTNSQYTYTQSRWATPPSKAIALAVVKSLREQKIFANVLLEQSRAKSEYLLEVSVEDFEQYFSEDEKKSWAKVVLHYNLIDLKNSRVVASHTFFAKQDVQQLNALGGVKTLEVLLTQVVQKSGDWLAKVSDDL